MNGEISIKIKGFQTVLLFITVSVFILLMSCTIILDEDSLLTVNFISDGKTVHTEKFGSGAVVNEYTNLSHPCYKNLEGWYTDSGFSSIPYDFTNTITNDLNLYAKWDYAPTLEGNKYQICNWKQLQWIAEGETTDQNRLGFNYILKNDIIFPTPGEDDFPVYGFKPIGDTNSPFTGTFDGNNNIISNFYINTEHEDWYKEQKGYIGLFGVAEGPTEIKDVSVYLQLVKGGKKVGGLIGWLKEIGTLSNVSVQGGEIKGKENVGGLVGYTENSTVSGYATTDVSGDQNVGGLVGYTENSTVSGYATGDLNGKQNVGGLVGSLMGTTLTGYATGKVSVSNSGGGLVGKILESTSSETIIIGYATGDLNGKQNVGGLVGGNNLPEKGVIISGYWDIKSSGYEKSVGGGTGISATKNIIYNSESSTNTYTDKEANNSVIFNIENFTKKFTLPGVSQTWPQLKDYHFQQPTVSQGDNDKNVKVIWSQ